MNRRPKAGLLPLYLALYDKAMPEVLPQFEPFLQGVIEGLERAGVDVMRLDTCRVDTQFQAAVKHCEESGVDIIITLHLAYSPSLEAVSALVDTRLPILMLDTTMDCSFGNATSPDRIMFNHGIHGVQDLASVLRRRGKAFEIVAGHVSGSGVLPRAANIARAAYGAKMLRHTRALRIGERFHGMGDFAVSDGIMKNVLGISVHELPASALADEIARIDAAQVETELSSDRACFKVEAPEKAHRRSIRVGLGLRRLLDTGGYNAFSMNFLAFDTPEEPVNAVPFLEASKAMARGLGYAGEGDVLTAALVGALNSAFGKTTFTEIFCPDWKGNALFLSHMGEINPETAAEKPVLVEKPFPYTPAENPAVLACAVAPGPAVLVNLAPGPECTFGLVIAPVNVLDDSTAPEMRNVVRGWVRPVMPMPSFLEEYSLNGGTHHSALVLGERLEEIETWARLAGIPAVVLA